MTHQAIGTRRDLHVFHLRDPHRCPRPRFSRALPARREGRGVGCSLSLGIMAYSVCQRTNPAR